MPLKSPIQVTLFLWATDVMSYSNIRPPLSKPYLCFLLFYNSFLRPHFHVFCRCTICNFPRIPTFQVPHMKMSTVPGPCPRSSRCPLTTSLSIPTASHPPWPELDLPAHTFPYLLLTQRTNEELVSLWWGLRCLTWAASETICRAE